jgi:hypothetical protein
VAPSSTAATTSPAPSWQSPAQQAAAAPVDRSFDDEDGDELDIPDFLK